MPLLPPPVFFLFRHLSWPFPPFQKRSRPRGVQSAAFVAAGGWVPDPQGGERFIPADFVSGETSKQKSQPFPPPPSGLRVRPPPRVCVQNDRTTQGPGSWLFGCSADAPLLRTPPPPVSPSDSIPAARQRLVAQARSQRLENQRRPALRSRPSAMRSPN